ncbi:ABC transporter permease [Paenibacillus monticola]|uniref:ABC transporter permease subunit n=1 Tax=Paenibacillus monticola TaxID=2666075 RepID=A0A7X2H3Y9_9BACL|nr:iron ABC transporter permease [Paenibacillus monticola]MRN52293.1 ABC transporter permease subunit [Paenibacillus monticola]
MTMERIRKYVTLGNIIGLIIGLFLTWFVVAFLVYPNLNLLKAVFWVNGTFSIEPIQKLLHSTRALKSLLNSFILAVSMVVTVNIIGIFLVFVNEYFDIKGSRLLRIGYYTTLVYSGIVLVSGYKFLYGEQGFITKFLSNMFPFFPAGWFHGYWAVIFVMTFACTSNHVLFLTNAIRKIDFQTVEAARNMGASSFYILRRVVLPVLQPTLFAITILLFLTGLGATSAPLIVGGTEFQTITPMILAFSKSPTSRDMAAVLAIFLGAATLILLIFLRKIEKKGNYISVSKVKSEIQKQKIGNKWLNALVHVLAYLLFIVYALPVLLTITFSFTDAYSISTSTLSWSHFTIANYRMLFTEADAYQPYIISIVYSAAAAILVVALSLTVSRFLHKYSNICTTALEYAMLIPWLLPSTLIALGLIITYDTPRWILANNVLTGTMWILMIAYVIVLIPFTLRMLRAAFFAVDSSLEDAAKSLGASTFYTFRRVILPIVLPSTLAILALNFNSHLADYDLTIFLYHPLFKPLGIAIQNATSGQTTADTQALGLVYSVVLMVISTVTLYLVYGRKSKA